jgi:excisionase family DNA binding protein
MPPVSLITVQQAASALGVGRSRVQALIAAGRLPAEKVGMQYLIKPADLVKVKDRKPGRPRTTAKPRKPRKR